MRAGHVSGEFDRPRQPALLSFVVISMTDRVDFVSLLFASDMGVVGKQDVIAAADKRTPKWPN